ncbi:ABC transporter permease subunit [Nocardia sp. ET3-3]|uniref:ABC transporter permease subunit n=1 Tax=Nocardia terrae TaxID=2675851 RepID=A0A7K1V1G3_9NOCA|nr:ABC transporter permease subunit [Nocardia terrae]MVU80371.1 ABC transporter permease subunit [Nocardia terrae]
MTTVTATMPNTAADKAIQAEVIIKTLRDSRRSLLGWTLGITAAATAYAGFYPQIAKNGAAQTQNLPESLREALRMNDITSAPGYLGSTVFGLIVPLLTMFFGAALGARVTAADEETGTLDLLLAHPLTRTSLIAQRFAALVLAATGVSAILWLAMLAVRGGADLTAVTPARFAAQCAQVALLTIIFGALATGIGAVAGRRGAVFALTAVVGVAAYGTHTFAAQLGLGWAAYLSPFHYYIGGEPLRNGFQWADLAILAAVSMALVVGGTYRFNRRDLRN